MKKVNLLVLGLVVTMGFSSCLKEDSFDESAQLELEKPRLKEYAEANFDNPQENKISNIWFEILEEGDPDSYEYKLIPDPNDLSKEVIEVPVVSLKYSFRSLDNTIVKENISATDVSLGNAIWAWLYAFYPQVINGRSIEPRALTANGLKKGSKIRFATPSLWAFRNNNIEGIPANTPLVYEIEVLDIHSPNNDAE